MGVWVFVENEDGVGWTRPAVAQERGVALQRGFNLVTWTAPARAIGDAIASLGGDIVAIFVWDALTQQFRVHRVDGPAFLNDLDEVLPGQAMWVDVRADALWEQV